MQEFLPGMRADGVAEQRRRRRAAPADSARRPARRSSRRQIGDAVDVVIDDRLVAKLRPDDAVAARGERADQRIEAGACRHLRRIASCFIPFAARQTATSRRCDV